MSKERKRERKIDGHMRRKRSAQAHAIAETKRERERKKEVCIHFTSQSNTATVLKCRSPHANRSTVFRVIWYTSFFPPLSKRLFFFVTLSCNKIVKIVRNICFKCDNKIQNRLHVSFSQAIVSSQVQLCLALIKSSLAIRLQNKIENSSFDAVSYVYTTHLIVSMAVDYISVPLVFKKKRERDQFVTTIFIIWQFVILNAL